jgi:hypothetical protein
MQDNQDKAPSRDEVQGTREYRKGKMQDNQGKETSMDEAHTEYNTNKSVAATFFHT